MRRYLKEPVPQIFAAWQALSEAVDAHIAGDFSEAEQRFRDANCPVIWKWLDDSWLNTRRNIVVHQPLGDTQPIPKDQRDPDRAIAKEIRAAVLARDGYCCRYCGLPVVHSDIRKIASALYPEAVEWNARVSSRQYSAFQVFWLQFDHVEPHSHGGRSDLENVVVSCALCNFGKFDYTLRQLDLEDPRLRQPCPSPYDGLERFRPVATGHRGQAGQSVTRANISTSSETADLGTYFIPGAWISAGYVNTPPIDGKTRWFKLGSDVSAEAAIRGGKEGCLLVCHPTLLERRGLDPLIFSTSI